MFNSLLVSLPKFFACFLYSQIFGHSNFVPVRLMRGQTKPNLQQKDSSTNLHCILSWRSTSSRSSWSPILPLLLQSSATVLSKQPNMLSQRKRCSTGSSKMSKRRSISEKATLTSFFSQRSPLSSLKTLPLFRLRRRSQHHPLLFLRQSQPKASLCPCRRRVGQAAQLDTSASQQQGKDCSQVAQAASQPRQCSQDSSALY